MSYSRTAAATVATRSLLAAFGNREEWVVYPYSRDDRLVVGGMLRNTQKMLRQENGMGYQSVLSRSALDEKRRSSFVFTCLSFSDKTLNVLRLQREKDWHLPLIFLIILIIIVVNFLLIIAKLYPTLIFLRFVNSNLNR